VISHFVVAKLFPKETEVNPARIPPQTPPAGGKSAEAGRIHIPSQLFRPAESGLVLFEKGSRKVYNYSISYFSLRDQLLVSLEVNGADERTWSRIKIC